MKKLFVIVFALQIVTGQAQESRDWRIKTAFSFAPGLLTEKTYSLQLQGYLAFIQEKIEFRGEAFYFLNQFGERPRFSMNHQIYTGAFYHFTEGAFQPYVGFQPGIAISQSSEYGALNEETNELNYKITANPVGSIGGGFDFYGQKWFYLFAETRYIFGKHKSDTYPVYLDEWRCSFGLGVYF
ncbi:MAG: hypothetical protein IPM74_14990 [Crocinitomicaceae bacterium]|nr:hypothetical protein [Crocinitomicaceae bacterium]